MLFFFVAAVLLGLLVAPRVTAFLVAAGFLLYWLGYALILIMILTR